jgi:hypothetical protein
MLDNISDAWERKNVALTVTAKRFNVVTDPFKRHALVQYSQVLRIQTSCVRVTEDVQAVAWKRKMRVQ